MVTILDGFEDGDISEYSGDANRFDVNTNNPYAGSYALELLADSTGLHTIFRDDVVINTGETPFGCYVNPGTTIDFTSTVGHDAGLIFGDDITNQLNHYYCTLDGRGPEFALIRDDASGGEILFSTNNFNVDLNSYYEIRITTWDSNGNIDAELRDTNGTVIASGGAIDSTYTNSGWGLRSLVDGPDGADNKAFIDNVFKTFPVTVPENVQITDASTENQLTIDWQGGGEAGYYVYRAQSSGSSTSDYTQVADVSSPPYTDTGLEDGEEYYYRVSSHD